MKIFRNRLVSCFVLLCCSAASARAQAVLELTATMYRIEAEVAATDEMRMVGLMYRPRMAANHGMLFVFDHADRHCMWMKNTLIPLAVAFLDSQGRIVNIEEMKPLTEETHCAVRPAMFALEMNGGWFHNHGLGAGVAIGGVDRTPAAR